MARLSPSMNKIALLTITIAVVLACGGESDPIDTNGDGRRDAAELCTAICVCEVDAEACEAQCSMNLSPDAEAVAECVHAAHEDGFCAPYENAGGVCSGTRCECSVD